MSPRSPQSLCCWLGRPGWECAGQGGTGGDKGLTSAPHPPALCPVVAALRQGGGQGQGGGTDTCHSRHHPPRPGVPTLQQGLVALGAPMWDSTQVGPRRQGQPVPDLGLSFGDIPHGSTHPLSPCPAGDPGSPRNSAGTTVPAWFVTRKETDLGGLRLVAAGSLSPAPWGHLGCPALSHRVPFAGSVLGTHRSIRDSSVPFVSAAGGHWGPCPWDQGDPLALPAQHSEVGFGVILSLLGSF